MSRLALLQGVTRAANEADTLQEALQAAMRLVCDSIPFHWAHTWLTQARNDASLILFDFWYPGRDPSRTLFRIASHRLRPIAADSLPGRVLQSGRPIWSSEIEELLPHRCTEARAAGIRTVAAFPATVGREVVAVLEFFSTESLAAAPGITELLLDLGRQLGELVERKRLQREYADAMQRKQQEFAQQLHDDLCQDLTGLSLLGKSLAEQLREKNLGDWKDAEALATGLQRALEKTRDIAHGVLPVEFDEPQGLGHALRRLAWTTTSTRGVQCRFTQRGTPRLKNALVATQIFRIAQEAVNNAVLHAQATRVEVEMAARDGIVSLEIRDDGKGIREADLRKERAGVRIMRYRTGLLGGTFSIGPRKPAGTSVLCEIGSKSEGTT
ncbi:MAG: GAF domain-containing protein [Planctomycetes bacterium]|nr:GAF domain-containing protein [Planctomycetota bacterium]